MRFAIQVLRTIRNIPIIDPQHLLVAFVRPGRELSMLSLHGLMNLMGFFFQYKCGLYQGKSISDHFDRFKTFIGNVFAKTKHDFP
jgi:hypothetical protein